MILLGGCSCSVVQALIWLSWVRSPVGCFVDDVIQLPLRERVEVVDASYVLGVGPIHVVIARAVSGLITVARNISVSASRGVLTRNIAVHLPWRWMRASRLMVLVLRPLVLAVELPCWGQCLCLRQGYLCDCGRPGPRVCSWDVLERIFRVSAVKLLTFSNECGATPAPAGVIICLA